MPVGTRRALLLLLSIVVSLGAAELVLRAAGFGRITPGHELRDQHPGGPRKRAASSPTTTSSGPCPPGPRPIDKAIDAVHPTAPGAAQERPPPPDRAGRLVLAHLHGRAALLGAAGAAPGAPVGGASTPRCPATPPTRGWSGCRSSCWHLKPDLVVVYFGWNDHWRSTGVTDRQYAKWHAVSHFRLLTLLRRMPGQAARCGCPWTSTRRNLHAMVDEITRRRRPGDPGGGALPFHGEAVQHLEQTGYILQGRAARRAARALPGGGAGLPRPAGRGRAGGGQAVRGAGRPDAAADARRHPPDRRGPRGPGRRPVHA